MKCSEMVVITQVQRSMLSRKTEMLRTRGRKQQLQPDECRMQQSDTARGRRCYKKSKQVLNLLVLFY
jgi:hypothetical protein